MKSIIFVPAVVDTQWIAEIVDGRSLAELPIAGKRIIDYNIEVAQNMGMEMCEILDWNYSRSVAESFSELTSGTVPVFYQNCFGPKLKGLIDIQRLSTPLTQNMEDGITVVWGLCLPVNPHEVGAEFEPLAPGECADTPTGVYHRINGRWMRLRHKMYAIRSPRDWLEISISLLHNSAGWTLPGYSAEKNAHLGRNVVLEHGTRVRTPVLLQDNAWCARNVTLDGDVIVGQGSFISEGAYLKHTLVGDDTYIGTGLELVDKIVIGRRIIDAETGFYTDIEEPGLARGLGGGIGWLKKLVAFIHGKSRGRAA